MEQNTSLIGNLGNATLVHQFSVSKEFVWGIIIILVAAGLVRRFISPN